VLRTPGAAAFSLSGWFGRFPKSNLSLGLILLVSSTTGSFAEAGLASAGLVAGMAFSGPFWSARMDRGGQRRVIAVALACLVASTALTSTLVVLRAPLPLWLAGAVLTGLSCPDIAAAVRARWTAATGGSLRIAAFAVETINDQMVFVVGPPIITVLSGTVHPLLGVAAALAPGVAGMLALVAQPGTEPPLHPLSERGKGWSARLPPLSILPVTLGCVGIGSFFGSYDVSVVAWGEDHGAPWASGVLLAVMAVAMGLGRSPRGPADGARGRAHASPSSSEASASSHWECPSPRPPAPGSPPGSSPPVCSWAPSRSPSSPSPRPARRVVGSPRSSPTLRRAPPPESPPARRWRVSCTTGWAAAPPSP